MRVPGVTELVPDLLSEVLVEQGALLIWFEDRLGGQVMVALEMRACNALLISLDSRCRHVRLLFWCLSLLLSAGRLAIKVHGYRLDLLCRGGLTHLSWLVRHARVLELLGGRAGAALLGAGTHEATVLSGCETGEEGANITPVFNCI